MNVPRVLIAGIGNIFLGDDAFGSEVAQRLLRRPWPDGVRVVDFGIRGLDLAYALLDGYEAVILVDAAPRGGAPGTLTVLELDQAAVADAPPMIEAHSMDPVKVLRLAAEIGGPVRQLRYLVGCEPSPGGAEESMEMSGPVRAAVEPAVALVESLAVRLLRGEPIGSPR